MKALEYYIVLIVAIIVGILLGVLVGVNITNYANNMSNDLVEYVVIVDDNQYDIVTANEFVIDDMGSLIFKKDDKNESSYACGYWTRVFDKRKANIEKEESASEPVGFEVINKEEETNVDTGASP